MSESLFPLLTKHFLIQPSDVQKPLESDWTIKLNKDSDDVIGHIHFDEGIYNGEMKITVDLDSMYDKIAFNQEIFYSMARFAFKFVDVKEISTVCRHENEERVKGLEKAGYVRRETVNACDHYSMRKQKTSWTGFYVFIGLIAGFLIGILISNLWVGTIGGILIGIILGYLMDKKESKDPV